MPSDSKETCWKRILNQGDYRHMWKGLKEITSFKGKPCLVARADPFLVHQLKSFYARYKTNNTRINLLSSAAMVSRDTYEELTLSVSEYNVRKFLKWLNGRKPAGPDGISSRILKSCADRLSAVFTKIFITSLARHYSFLMLPMVHHCTNAQEQICHLIPP